MIVLSENHHRAVMSIASVLERKLEEFENYLFRTSFNARGIRILHNKVMDDEQIQKLQENIDNLYEMLEQFCADHGISKEPISFKKEISVKASFLWEELSGAINRKIAGHDYKDNIIKEDYTRHIDDMIRTINNIIRYCNEI